KLAKQEGREDEVVAICTQAINLFRLLMTWLSPVIPLTAEKAAVFLDAPLDDFSRIGEPLLDHEINKFKPLLQRVDEKQTDALIEASKASLEEADSKPDTTPEKEDHDMIKFDDFLKVDLRVARLVKAEEVEGADKQLR